MGKVALGGLDMTDIKMMLIDQTLYSSGCRKTAIMNIRGRCGEMVRRV